jgi:rhodanese-related sulfurtransferase
MTSRRLRRALGQTLTRRTISDMLDEARTQLGHRPTPNEAHAAAQAGEALLIDIRAGDVRDRDGTVPGAIHHQRTVLEWRADPDCEWRDERIADLDAPLLLFCSQGYASSLAAQTLREMGFTRVTDMDGGFDAWKDHGLPVQYPRDGCAGTGGRP